MLVGVGFFAAVARWLGLEQEMPNEDKNARKERRERGRSGREIQSRTQSERGLHQGRRELSVEGRFG